MTGGGPWRVALRRLRQDRVALCSGAILLALVVVSAAAPLWADLVAGTTPERNRITDTVVVDGQQRDVVAVDGTPIGPTWQGELFLGADRNGRDVMVRLLYGGRTSLLIAFGATAITMLLATALGLAAGWFGGWVDAIVTRSLDVLWAFPAILLAIMLGVAFTVDGVALGPVVLEPGSLLIPILVIALSSIAYVARPVRAQVATLRGREFVEAARAQGQGSWRTMTRELLPNLTSLLLVLAPVVAANTILLEAALSFLGAGVQAPTPSWGTMIADGVQVLITAPHLTIVPGLVLALTVFSLHLAGEAVRRAFDPHGAVPAGRARWAASS